MNPPGLSNSGQVRPGVRRLAIIAAVVLVPIAAHSAWDYVEVRRLVAEIQAIEAKGEPVSVRQAGPALQQSTRNDQLAGRYYLAASMLCEPLPYDTIGTFRAQATRSAAPQPELASRLRAVVADSSDALRLADKAATLAFDGFAPGTAYSYRTSQLLCLSALMSARTMSLSAANQGDEAVESVLGALKLRPALEEVRWSIRGSTDTAAILSLSRPTPAALTRLQTALENEDRPGTIIDGLLEERARVLEMIWKEAYGSDPRTPASYRLPFRGFAQLVVRPWFTHQAVRMLKAWASFIDAARKPWPEAVDALAAVKGDYQLDQPRASRGSGRIFTLMVTASYPSMAFIQPEPIIVDRASRVALAVERFRRDHSDALPSALNELIPGYLSAIPQDLFSGGPLLYARQPDAYTIYSVGPDKRDDRGEVVESEPRSASRAPGSAAAGADIGVRVVIRR